MRKASVSLTRRQVILLIALFVGDVAILAAGFYIIRGQPAPRAQATPVVSAASCQTVGAEQLAARGLAGVARLDADGSLRFDLTGQGTAGQALPRPAEAAWDVLAAAVAVSESGCGPYRAVRVDVPDSTGPPGTRLLIEINWIDFRAWGERELDDSELAARSKTASYPRP